MEEVYILIIIIKYPACIPWIKRLIILEDLFYNNYINHYARRW
jgi:hypothetical protein